MTQPNIPLEVQHDLTGCLPLDPKFLVALDKALRDVGIVLPPDDQAIVQPPPADLGCNTAAVDGSSQRRPTRVLSPRDGGPPKEPGNKGWVGMHFAVSDAYGVRFDEDGNTVVWSRSTGKRVAGS